MAWQTQPDKWKVKRKVKWMCNTKAEFQAKFKIKIVKKSLTEIFKYIFYECRFDYYKFKNRKINKIKLLDDGRRQKKSKTPSANFRKVKCNEVFFRYVIKCVENDYRIINKNYSPQIK